MIWMLTLISGLLFQSLNGQDSHHSQQNEKQQHHHLHLRKHEEQPHDSKLHQRFQVLPLADNVLCNNHSTNEYLAKNYLSFNEHRQEKSWTERLSQVTACEVIQLQLFTTENSALHDKNIRHLLSELFLISDASKSVRRIVIQFLKESHSFVSRLVDEMITPRPWLDVVDETFPSLDSSEHRATTGTLYHIILDRYHQDYEDYLKLVSSVQFPDHETCLSTPFMLNRKGCDHPGWASVLGMYYLLHSEMPFGITSIYVSNSNFVNQSTPFVSPEDCPTLKNRWECTFLPTTNCSLPTFIKDCFSQNCVGQYPDSTYFSAVFTNMSDDAVYLSREHNETEYKRMVQIAKTPRNMQQTNYSHQYNRIPGLQYLVPRSLAVVPATGELDFQLITVAVGQVLFNNIYLRKNSFYRFKIQEYYKEFYERYPFLRREMNYFQPAETEFRCIAAHVRRGDRIVYGENMTDYCKTHQSHRDAGCGGPVPFGMVSLDGVVKNAELLVNKNSTNAEENGKKKKYNLVIASDDPFWLEEQKELYDKAHPDSEWNIVTIFPSSEFNFTRTTFENQEKYLNAIRFLRYLGKTKSGVLFHSTIQLFQECDGFLGHFGSGVAWMLFRAMCHRNNLGKGICPPVYDLRSGLT
jgi:hypothetical protein